MLAPEPAMSGRMPAVDTVTTREANDRDLTTVATLAGSIFRQHYPGILSVAQIDYMLAKLYSAAALRRQRQLGHVFLLALINEKPAAFASFALSQEETNEAQIHKLYVLPEHHGRRIGVRLIDEVTTRVQRLDRRRLVLTVNRLNIQAINFYFREGFTIRSVVDTDIGGGYAMQDFVMEKLIGDASGIRRLARR
jgi:ribosomal protein S18 acetylase RimI-like enzyme